MSEETKKEVAPDAVRDFTDAKGRIWRIQVNVGAMRRVKNDSNYDLAELVDEKFYQTVYLDPLLTSELIWSIVRPQNADVSQEDFEESLPGFVFAKAKEAFFEVVECFFVESSEVLRNFRQAMELQNKVVREFLTSPEYKAELEAKTEMFKQNATAMMQKQMEEIEETLSPPPTVGA